MDNNRASNMLPKLWDYKSVGEHSTLRRRCTVRYTGASRKANVGISNDKGGAKPPRRKTKVS